MSQRHLTILTGVLNSDDRSIPTWLERLLLYGLEPEAFEAAPPARIRITEMLAWWSKWAGLTREEAQEWLMPFCTEVLSALSKSGPSAVRHGTKSAIRYVYASEHSIDFASIDRETDVKESEHPPYIHVYAWWEEELRKKAEREAELRKQRAEASKEALQRKQEETNRQRKARANTGAQAAENANVDRPVRVKDRYKEQFDQAMAQARRESEAGRSLKAIVDDLNTAGFRTRTGREWTLAILRTELRRGGTR